MRLLRAVLLAMLIAVPASVASAHHGIINST